MAKQLIATLVTNSNGEAFYTYTGTGAGQTTFMAESGELESNSLTINDINQELTITADKNILSYADNESCTITATYEGPSVNGQTVVFKNGDTILATKTTDSNGIATYDYQSQGVGDVTITVECMNLQETYEVHDYWKYIASGSYTGTSSISFQELYESSVYDNIEISATIKAPNKGFSLAFLKSKDSSSSIQDNIFTIGVDGANYTAVSRVENGNIITYNSDVTQQYTANSDLNCVIRIENGVVTLKLNNLSYTSTPITGLKYIGVRNWNNAKTVTYIDFIVKPL